MDKRVFIAGCQDYHRKNVEIAIQRALKVLGGVQAMDLRGKKVLIKANLLSANKADRAVTTHPEVVGVLARIFMEGGAEVTIADSPAGPYNRNIMGKVYRACGMEKVSEETGAKLNFDMTHKHLEYPQGKYSKGFDIITPILEADLIINVAKLKTHGLTYYTGAVKNLFGTIPGLEKARFHSRYPDRFKFSGVLVDLCELVKPNISFMDGIIGMEGAGPSGGKAKHVGALGASLNPHALDLAMSDLVSLPLRKIPMLTEAIHRGLIPKDAGQLEYLGDAPTKYKTTFQPAIEGHNRGNPVLFLLERYLLPKSWKESLSNMRSPWPKILDHCIACGKCADICPRQIIKIHQKAEPDYSGCIRCYCCHEVCPIQAIDLVKKSKLGTRGQL